MSFKCTDSFNPYDNPTKVCGILMPITKKLLLKGEITYSSSHSWKVMGLEFKSKQSGSGVYMLNHDINNKLVEIRNCPNRKKKSHSFRAGKKPKDYLVCNLNVH